MITVVCEVCGSEESYEEENGYISIPPCSECMKITLREGYSQGYGDGFEFGELQGKRFY